MTMSAAPFHIELCALNSSETYFEETDKLLFASILLILSTINNLAIPIFPHLSHCSMRYKPTARMKSRRWTVLLAMWLVATPALMSCEYSRDNPDAGPAVGDELRLEEVRGMVLEVESESLISLAALEVQDAAGKVWRFEGRGKVVPGFTPSHLNEHKLLGQAVTVTYYREGEELVLHNITD